MQQRAVNGAQAIKPQICLLEHVLILGISRVVQYIGNPSVFVASNQFSKEQLLFNRQQEREVAIDHMVHPVNEIQSDQGWTFPPCSRSWP